jgi:hypothetical protein
MFIYEICKFIYLEEITIDFSRKKGADLTGRRDTMPGQPNPAQGRTGTIV